MARGSWLHFIRLKSGGKLSNSAQAGLTYLNANNNSGNSNSNIRARTDACMKIYRTAATALAEIGICPIGASRSAESSGWYKQA